MIMSRRVIVYALVALLVFSFAACGKKDVDVESSSQPTSSDASSVEQDDADDLTSSELDELAKDFVENTDPSIVVIPNDSSSSGSDSTDSSSSDVSGNTSSSPSHVSGWTPFF